MSVMLVYIAGAYQGLTWTGIEENIYKARQVAIQVWRAGHIAICPHLNTALFDREPDLIHLSVDDYANRDLQILSFCDAVVLVDNWQTSAGAKKEKIYAQTLGIPVFISVDELIEYQWMTLEQESHLSHLKRDFCRWVDKKYRAGQKEHGGNLWQKDVTKNAIDEAIDMVVYLLTLQEQIETNGFPPKNPLKDKDETCERCGTIHLNGDLCRGAED